jgi:sporulation protein YlmC with PRC-barrel domain
VTDLGTPDDDGRVIYAALHLLDHQMLDRDGTRCGNVDDLELTEQDDGTLLVTDLLAGPGVLAERMGWHRLGRWWRHATNAEDSITIPMSDVAEIGSDIRLGVAAAGLATANTERWARERIIEHIPGHSVRSEPDD